MYGFTQLQQALTYLTPSEQEKITRAFEFAAHAHREQKRKSGEAYITHPVAVAHILADMRMDADTICAGLLHDTVEDTPTSLEQLSKEFGADVAKIVEGETKVSKLTKLTSKKQLLGAETQTKQDQQAENLRQMLVAMTGDIRVMFVKLADRLHNMRTLGSMPPEKQKRISKETLQIFAPLAHRLGVGHIKWQLEDLCFQYLEPEAYQALIERIDSERFEREAHVENAIERLCHMTNLDGDLKHWVGKIEISGRSKHLYSIHSKMVSDKKNIEQIFDLLAIRVILTPKSLALNPEDFNDETELQEAKNILENTREKQVCYHTLGLVHSIWTPIPGRFKDYIAVPKSNGYQSLHTTIISRAGMPIEVQIRTAKMHQVAEYGVAAHWLYKQTKKEDTGAQRIQWLNQLEQLQNEITDANDFVDAVMNDLLSGRVVVLSPKGDTYNLPTGATPIDFAYHVHTRVGETCAGARVNGQIVPLIYELQNGDHIEILTNKNATPSKDWINFAATRSARSKIRQYFRTRERAESIQHGHDLLEDYLRRKNLAVRQLMRTKLLEDATQKLLGTRNPDELYMALHAGRMSPMQVTKVLAPQFEAEQQAVPTKPVSKTPNPVVAKAGAVEIDGLNTAARPATCCKPIQNDEVMGYLTRGRGVTLHRVDCPNMKRLMSTEPERCMSIRWDKQKTDSLQVVDLDVVCHDRSGLLLEIAGILSEQKRNILDIRGGSGRSGVANIYVRTHIRDPHDLSMLADSIRKHKDVREVFRVAGARKRQPIPPASGRA